VRNQIFYYSLAKLANSGDIGTVLLKEHFLNMNFVSNFKFQGSKSHKIMNNHVAVPVVLSYIENISKWPMLGESNLFLIESKM
jgi:hypothetical protein